MCNFFPDWPCNAILTDDIGQFASPKWPMQYSTDLDCSWVIKAPSKVKINLQFSAIDLEGAGYNRCSDVYDIIKVSGKRLLNFSL